MMYEVMRPFRSHEGQHQPGEQVAADAWPHAAKLVDQRFIRPVGDADRVDDLELKVMELEERLARIESRSGGAQQ